MSDISQELEVGCVSSYTPSGQCCPVCNDCVTAGRERRKDGEQFYHNASCSDCICQVLYVCGLCVCVVSAVRYCMCCAPYVVLKGSGTACVFLYVWRYVCVVSSVLNYDIICVQSDNVLGRQACSLLGE